MTWYLTKSKYHNKSSVYDGYYYASKLEAGHAQNLDTLKRAGKIKDWKKQVTVELGAYDFKGRYHKICDYRCDFQVWWTDGRITLEETKGFETREYLQKRKLLELFYLPEHPELEYVVIK